MFIEDGARVIQSPQCILQLVSSFFMGRGLDYSPGLVRSFRHSVPLVKEKLVILLPKETNHRLFSYFINPANVRNEKV